MPKSEAGIGHNSGDEQTITLKVDKTAREHLIGFCERIQNIDEEIKTLRDDRAEVMTELKAFGLDRKAFTKAYRDYQKSKQPPNPRQLESEALSQMYLDVLLNMAEI